MSEPFTCIACGRHEVVRFGPWKPTPSEDDDPNAPVHWGIATYDAEGRACCSMDEGLWPSEAHANVAAQRQEKVTRAEAVARAERAAEQDAAVTGYERAIAAAEARGRKQVIDEFGKLGDDYGVVSTRAECAPRTAAASTTEKTPTTPTRIMTMITGDVPRGGGGRCGG